MKNLFIFTFIYLVLGFSLSSCEKVCAEKNNSKKYRVYALKHPHTLNFAGEQTPLRYWYVKESFDRELLVNTYWQSQTLLFLKRAHKYFPIIEPILKSENMPEDIKYIALIESGLIPTAASPSGAKGMWQFLKKTGIEYGLEINDEVDERYHISKSTKAACRYLKEAYDQFGNWTLAAAAYNAGRSKIAKQLKKQQVTSYYDLLLNNETSRYVFRILAVKTILESPEKYGFIFSDDDLYDFPKTTKVKVTTPVNNWATWAKNHNTNYMLLKKLNSWLRKPYLTNKRKKEYEILIPTNNK